MKSRGKGDQRRHSDANELRMRAELDFLRREVTKLRKLLAASSPAGLPVEPPEPPGVWPPAPAQPATR